MDVVIRAWVSNGREDAARFWFALNILCKLPQLWTQMPPLPFWKTADDAVFSRTQPAVEPPAWDSSVLPFTVGIGITYTRYSGVARKLCDFIKPERF